MLFKNWIKISGKLFFITWHLQVYGGGYVSAHLDHTVSHCHFMSFIRTNCNNLLLFLRPFLSLGQHQWVRVCVNAVRLVFLLLLKCVSMKTSSCALERWYGRWGGPSGRAHPYRLCQSISEQRPAFSHFVWKLHTYARPLKSARTRGP